MLSQAPVRSSCPINYALELFGDSWSLLIVRDIVYFGKRTFGEFLSSDEHIARNILANRLAQLQAKGLLVKRPHPTDKRKDLYSLTEAGLDIIPILFDLADWGSSCNTGTPVSLDWLRLVRSRRTEILERTRRTVRQGGSIFVGPGSVIAQVQPGMPWPGTS